MPQETALLSLRGSHNKMGTTIFYNTGGAITSVSEPTQEFSRGAGFNSFGEDSVTPGGGFQTILSIPVAANETVRIDGLTVWGDVDASFVVYSNASPVGGCRTTTAKVTENITYDSRPIVIDGPTTITIKAEHYSPVAYTLHANLYGSINTNAQ